jgi:tRNA G10  N-methylase Trm11
MEQELIKSISYDQDEIIKWIIKLHLKGKDIECDPCYSVGNFYKKINPPKYKFDINPQAEGVEQANAENLPLENESVDSVMFDPPFLATSGSSLKIENSSNKINKRFGVYPSEKELHQFYFNAMLEFHRILKPNGILIFKCQDKVSSGKQYLSHVFIIKQAVELGYYPKDMFVLLAKQRIVADWQLKNQKNARKFHSYFIILEKSNKKIEYV